MVDSASKHLGLRSLTPTYSYGASKCFLQMDLG